MIGITMSPEFTLYRTASDADDSLPMTDSKQGLSTADYEDVILEVVPSGVDPDIEILFWSEAAGKFVKENTAITYSGIGSDTPYQVRVKTLGRRIFVAVSGGLGAGDTVAIYAAGWR